MNHISRRDKVIVMSLWRHPFIKINDAKQLFIVTKVANGAKVFDAESVFNDILEIKNIIANLRIVYEFKNSLLFVFM